MSVAQQPVRVAAARNAARRASARYYINLDIVDELYTGTLWHGGKVTKGPSLAFRDELKSYDVMWKLLEREGPAGGNPLIRLYGTRENLERWLKEKYDDDEGYYASLIQKKP